MDKSGSAKLNKDENHKDIAVSEKVKELVIESGKLVVCNYVTAFILTNPKIISEDEFTHKLDLSKASDFEKLRNRYDKMITTRWQYFEDNIGIFKIHNNNVMLDETPNELGCAVFLSDKDIEENGMPFIAIANSSILESDLKHPLIYNRTIDSTSNVVMDGKDLNIEYLNNLERSLKCLVYNVPNGTYKLSQELSKPGIYYISIEKAIDKISNQKVSESDNLKEIIALNNNKKVDDDDDNVDDDKETTKQSTKSNLNTQPEIKDKIKDSYNDIKSPISNTPLVELDLSKPTILPPSVKHLKRGATKNEEVSKNDNATADEKPKVKRDINIKEENPTLDLQGEKQKLENMASTASSNLNDLPKHSEATNLDKSSEPSPTDSEANEGSWARKIFGFFKNEK